MRGLYIHIPFCLQKCKYCDFVSFAGCEYDKYMDMLFCEMTEYRGEAIDTVFIGGGTPTVLSVSLLEKLFKNIRQVFCLDKDCEFSIECNPKTIDDDKAKCMSEGGVNRVSVGVQSFNDDELKRLGRIHTAKDAYNTINILKKNNLHNINIDIMSALPKQTISAFMSSLDKAAAVGAEHISCYSLIIEEGTPFYEMNKKGGLFLPDEGADRAMYEYACDFLQRKGFAQYEISNFAKNGRQCRHNLKYWNCEEYIGIGLAAHSYMDGKRFYNTANLNQYIDGKFHTDDCLVLSEKDKIEEFMIMGLRKTCGISENEFLQRFGKSIDEVYGDIIEKFIVSGHMIHDCGYYRLSEKAVNVSNRVLCEFC